MGNEPGIQNAVKSGDVFSLANTANADELERLHLAEQFLERHNQRNKQRTAFARLSQAMIGYVAFAGLVVNAYQSYANNQKQVRQLETDNARWNKEFERATASDKYRAFFETSVLATDRSNLDKRLVGYALLQEFVDDKDYNSKATLMLEESLLQELRSDTSDKGLDDEHRTAVVAIVTSLSQTSDCHALERPARSIGKVARRGQETNDIDETSEVFGVYVRRIVGRAAALCPTLKEFRHIRAPILETLTKIPEIGSIKGKLTPDLAADKIAEMLEQRCASEMSLSGASDCGEIYAHYAKICANATPREIKDEEAACARMKAAAAHAADQTGQASHD